MPRSWPPAIRATRRPGKASIAASVGSTLVDRLSSTNTTPPASPMTSSRLASGTKTGGGGWPVPSCRPPAAPPPRAGRRGRSGRCAGCARPAGRAGPSSRRWGRRRRRSTPPAARAGPPAPAAGRCHRWRLSGPPRAGSRPTACPGSRSARRRASPGGPGAARVTATTGGEQGRSVAWVAGRLDHPVVVVTVAVPRVPRWAADVAPHQAAVAPSGQQMPGDSCCAALALGAGDTDHPVAVRLGQPQAQAARHRGAAPGQLGHLGAGSG